MTDMIRAIDNQEVQLALRPSMTTGWTLAETVEWKLRDVNDRIVVCTRIMFAAKDNVRKDPLCSSIVFFFFSNPLLFFFRIQTKKTS